MAGFPAFAQEEEPAPAAGEAASGGPSEVNGPRDLLRLRGIDESHFGRLTDGVPWDESDDETLLKMMYHVGRDFRLADVEDWSHGEVDPAELAADAAVHRGEIFHLSGRVVRAGVRLPVPEAVERFEIEQYYVCRFLLADGEQPAVVFSAKVPEAWPMGEPIDERAGAYGFFLKLEGEDPQRPVPVFVATRIAWYPEDLLGSLGMDAGLFDGLSRGRLTGHGRECFYQLLSAAGRAKPGQLRAEARKDLRRQQAQDELERQQAEDDLERQQGQDVPQGPPDSFSVVPLFNEPQTQQGRLVVLSGTARRIVPVRVSDEDVVARFGISHYYQLYVFTDDSQGNPVVFCVRELPEGMPTGDGPDFGEQVVVAGFFMKTWAYRIDRPDGDARPGWQLAPLLIGREAVWVPPEQSATNPMIAAAAGALFLVALVGVWFVIWRYHRSDRRFRQSTLARHLAPASGVSLDQLDLESGDGGGDAGSDDDRAHEDAGSNGDQARGDPSHEA